jgi:hypothetical protein
VRKVFSAPQAFQETIRTRGNCRVADAGAPAMQRHTAAVQSHSVDISAAMIFRLPIAQKRVPLAERCSCLEFIQRPL